MYIVQTAAVSKMLRIASVLYIHVCQGGVKGGMTGVRRVTDIQTDHGYDTEDPFVDDSEAVRHSYLVIWFQNLT